MRLIEGLRLKRFNGIQTILEQSLAVVKADDKIQFERHWGMRFGNFWTPSC